MSRLDKVGAKLSFLPNSLLPLSLLEVYLFVVVVVIVVVVWFGSKLLSASSFSSENAFARQFMHRITGLVMPYHGHQPSKN